MTNVFVLCLILAAAMLCAGIVCVFFAVRYPRSRARYLQAVAFCLVYAIVLLGWSYA
jgi:uncharacterized membrane protein HdeD (DUF308 family)